ncbi:hypothetical protein CC80DRAFT_490602 [Byssothecium circinans]|uniref:Coenzyme Q-binding protein COQ10 START domain-containing protein n=1 Tax=Byssothecium circinans TaxID=147558 RepID=A0A6A5U1J0_9PLEO|nr:hypothetical protein CC80DRAFT_490602 [Byssothecium circinans]
MAGFSTSLAFVLILISVATSQITNLPDVPEGVFNASARIEIKGTVDEVWEALTDFPSYPKWNPFVRYALAISPLSQTLPVQRPVEGVKLFFRVQIPPLPLPVDENTPDNLLNTQNSYENATHVQPELGRLAWKYLAPEGLLAAERWQAVTNIGYGKVLYESREVYSGLLAGALKETLEKPLQESFEAQANGLQLLLEG